MRAATFAAAVVIRAVSCQIGSGKIRIDTVAAKPRTWGVCALFVRVLKVAGLGIYATTKARANAEPVAVTRSANPNRISVWNGT